MAQAKKIKIGVLYSSEKPRWGSCVSISANLRASYAKLENDYEIHWLPIDSEKYQNDLCLGNGYIMGFAEGILKSKITKICFIDHHLKILPLLQALKIIEPQKWSKLEKIFHVYGDFTYFALDWQQTSPLLIGSHTALLCASDRQKDLVSFFEREVVPGSVSVCPFPVDSEFFRFSEKKRNQWRKKLGLAGEHLTLYAGRLSLQKGVLAAIREFQKLGAEKNNVVFAIAGTCDDIGSPTMAGQLPAGYFQQRFDEVLSTLAKSLRGRIRILGNLDRNELSGLYCAADSFISFSLYHDEDFGMAPAEALATGLPALLSDWGGYSSFAVPGTSVHLTPVSLSRRGLSFDTARIRSNGQCSSRVALRHSKESGRPRLFQINSQSMRLQRNLKKFSNKNHRVFPALVGNWVRFVL